MMTKANESLPSKNAIQSLSDSYLISSTEVIIQKERDIVECLMWHLEEIQARKLYISMGYESLYKCLIHHFKMSETTAYGRITVLEMMKEVPTITEDLKSGELNISNLKQAKTFINKHEKENDIKLSADDKYELLEKIKNKTTDEVKQYFAEIDPEFNLPKDQVRYLDDKNIQLQATTNKDLLKKIEYLKSLISHENINPTFDDLLNLAIDAAIEKEEKKRGLLVKLEKKASAKGHIQNKTATMVASSLKSNDLKSRDMNKNSLKPKHLPTQSLTDGSKRIFSRSDKRILFLRAKNQCEYVHAGGKRCNSKFQLQIDHVIPYSKGGKSILNNAQVLCRVHNNYKSDRLI